MGSEPGPTPEPTVAEICQHHIDDIENRPGVGPSTVSNLRAAVLDLLYLTRNTDAAAPEQTRGH